MNYRKICKEYYGYSDEEMIGMDVHHKDGNRSNNCPTNLILISPEEHAKIHEKDFVLWARIGAKLGNESLRNRLKTKGQTEKELAYKDIRIEKCKHGLHRKSHSLKSRKIISNNKKELFKDKRNHPMFGRTCYKVISPNNENFIINGDWIGWCASNNLSASNLRNVALGKRKHHKGWIAEIL